MQEEKRKSGAEKLPDGKLLPVGNLLSVGKRLPDGKLLPVGKLLSVRKRLPDGKLLSVGKRLPDGKLLSVGDLLPAVKLLLAVCLVLVFSVRAGAAPQQKVTDGAGIISQEQESRLQEQLETIAGTYEYDAVILTVDSCEGKSTQQYAEDYYLSEGYGFGPESDGIMMLVSMGERQYYFATFGNATDIFTAYGLERIDDIVSEKLSDGDYDKAFSLFADLTEEFVREGTSGKPYDTNHTYKQSMSLGMRMAIAAVAGVVIAAVTVGALFGQLKSVGIKAEAQEYVRDGSFRVTRQRDVFLYRTVSRIRREKPSDSGGGGGATHSTSSGGRAGGRGGSF